MNHRPHNLSPIRSLGHDGSAAGEAECHPGAQLMAEHGSHDEVAARSPLAPAEGAVCVPSVCKMCVNACGVRIHRVNGVVVKIEGNPDNPHSFGRLCAKGLSGLMGLYDPDRVRACLRRTNPRKGPGEDPGWREVSWEEAVQDVAARLRKIAAEDPRKLMIAGGIAEVDTSRFVLAAFAEAFGTPNYHTGVFFGTHTRVSYLNTGSMHTEPDLDHCRMLVLFGSQKGTLTGHDAMKSALAMADARARGMKLIVLDPVCSIIASHADEWVPILPGTDGAVALSMLHVLLNEQGMIDEPFLARQTNAAYLVGASGRYVRDATGKPLVWDRVHSVSRPFDGPDLTAPALHGRFQVDGQTARPALELLRERVAEFTPERVETLSTVPAGALRRIAREFGETALSGGSITLGGVRMPLRPACAFADSRGSTCHSQGLWTGTAIQLLDTVVGAVDVPGGSISTNIIGPGERPRVGAGPDGMIVFGGGLPGGEQQYPGRTPRAPETAQFQELFPIGSSPRPMLSLALLEYPHLLSYQLEMLIIAGSNLVMSGADPRRVAQALEKVPFVVALGDRMDETLECADLVFPVAHYLEQFDFPVNRMEGWVTGKHWYFTARQPAMEPPPGVRQTVDVLIEWADRAGMLRALNERLNAKLGLAEGQELEGDRHYSNGEIVERRMRSMFGPDHHRRWFEEHGLVAWQRSLAERYPRAIVKLPRMPVYFPHVPDRGRELKEVLDRLGLDWDLSLYQSMPVWCGCWSHRERKPEQLFLVNYKLPFETSTTSQGNPWLMGIARHHRLAMRVMLNSRTALSLGIADGDEVELAGTNGYTACGVARVAEGVHPDVVAVASCFGHWSRGQPVSFGKGVNFNSFVPLGVDRMDLLAGYGDHCALVTIRKAPRIRTK